MDPRGPVLSEPSPESTGDERGVGGVSDTEVQNRSSRDSRTRPPRLHPLLPSPLVSSGSDSGGSARSPELICPSGPLRRSPPKSPHPRSSGQPVHVGHACPEGVIPSPGSLRHTNPGLSDTPTGVQRVVVPVPHSGRGTRVPKITHPRTYPTVPPLYVTLLLFGPSHRVRTFGL